MYKNVLFLLTISYFFANTFVGEFLSRGGGGCRKRKSSVRYTWMRQREFKTSIYQYLEHPFTRYLRFQTFQVLFGNL